jgi:hypothetical protein
MFYCKKPKFVYLDCARCGSTSVMNHLGGGHKLVRYGARRHVLEVPKRMLSWPSFTVVRDPYTRMRSVYWLKWVNKRTVLPFEGWLEKIDSTRWAQHRFSQMADKFFKIEEIEEARDLPFWPKAEFPHNNNSKTNKTTTHAGAWEPMPDGLLTDEAKGIIAKRFSEDFTAHGYKK